MRGSSPRVWGQDANTIRSIGNVRIIPTRVGTSSTNGLLAAWNTDHPHACGDKSGYEGGEIQGEGSSPRVWGQGFAVYHGQGQFRIIPTRVGTSEGCVVGNAPVRDHPHACGDKNIGDSVTPEPTGSSPRVWGQDAFIGKNDKGVGIIPTRVGTRPSAKTPGGVCWDHPHACGDKETWLFRIHREQGSSPRVWGQAALVSSAIAAPGIIPTRVGTS